MIILILVGSPKGSVQWKLQLLSSASPIIVQKVSETFIIGHFVQLFILFLHELNKRGFCPGYVRIFTLPRFKSDDYRFEKLGSKDNLSIEFKLLSMSLNKNMIHFSQFVIVCSGDIQMWSQAKVVRRNFSKRFYISVSFYSFDMGSDDLLFLYRSRFFMNNVDNSVVRCLQIVELSFWKDHFKRFRPVLLFGSSSHKSKWLYLK